MQKDRGQQPYFSNGATDPDTGFFLTKADTGRHQV
jgi:hypothetical protein